MPSGMAKERCERRKSGVSVDDGGGDLARGEADRLEHAVVADALADREQCDGNERRSGDQQQHRLECVDEEQQLVREVTRLGGTLRVERRVEREHDDNHRAGERDRGCEEKRPAPSREEVFEPETDREWHDGSDDGARQP